MKNLSQYINEAQKWDEWEREFYSYRKENGFTGTIDDLVTDENGFSSEMAMDFYQLYLQGKKDKEEERKYNNAMKNMSDENSALKETCTDKTAEEIAWLVASAISSAVPVNKVKMEIPFARGLQKSVFEVNYKGINIYIYDKCYEFMHGYGKGYTTKPGFSVLCSPDMKYKSTYTSNLIACEISKRKYDNGKFRTYLYNDASIKHLCELIDNNLKEQHLL